jgi:hypothetical protein
MWPLIYNIHIGENIAISDACKFGDACVLRNLEHVVLCLPSSDFWMVTSSVLGFTYDVKYDNGGNL